MPQEIALGLQNCANELTKWNNVVFAQIPKKIQEKRKAQFSYYLGKKMVLMVQTLICFKRRLRNFQRVKKLCGTSFLESIGLVKVVVPEFSLCSMTMFPLAWDFFTR